MAAGHLDEKGYYVIGPLICSWTPGGFSQCGLPQLGCYGNLSV